MSTEPKGRTRYLSDDELTALLSAAQAHSARLHAAILTNLATGIRQGEMIRLAWADIDFDRTPARILETKNGQASAIYLPPFAVETLNALRRAGVVGARNVFLTEAGVPFDKDTLEYRWTLVRKAAGLVDFKWQDLRRSCASVLAQKGATLLEIGSVLDHKSPSVTARYAHLVQGAPVSGHAALDTELRGQP